MIVTGNLKDFSLSDIIKMSCVDIQTCQIIIKTNAGEGVIYFSNGMPVHAQLGNAVGEEAIYRLLDETEKFGGVFRVEPDIVLPKRTITSTWDIIMEDRNDRAVSATVPTVAVPKSDEKESYPGRREAITRVLQNFRAQTTAKRVPPVAAKPVTVTPPSQPVPTPPVTVPPVTTPPAVVPPAREIVDRDHAESKSAGRGGSLSQVLKNLMDREHDIIEGVALVSTEGFIIASALPSDLEDEHVAAISAVVLSLGERITTELRRGTLEQVYVRGQKGYVFLAQAGPDALLTVITSPNAKLGMIFLDTKRTIKELEPML
ncbi:roadblock/LC7 domain-containing protein [candidate division KSB1 bacterium]|nr:roadblock/LC7 domain-containing protein [candidate division KSB1 bacterium]